MQQRELETRLTQKGQVTIPLAIRSRLGLKPKDRVRFELEGEVVVLRRAPSRLARHFGAARAASRAGAPPLDWRAEREAFEQGVAQEVGAEDR